MPEDHWRACDLTCMKTNISITEIAYRKTNKTKQKQTHSHIKSKQATSTTKWKNHHAQKTHQSMLKRQRHAYSIKYLEISRNTKDKTQPRYRKITGVQFTFPCTFCKRTHPNIPKHRHRTFTVNILKLTSLSKNPPAAMGTRARSERPPAGPEKYT